MLGRDGNAGRVTALLCAAAGVWIGMRFEERILPALLPLLTAVVAARLVSPGADAVSRAFRIKRKTAGAVLALMLCTLALWLAGMLGGRLAAELTEIIGQLPGWIELAAEKTESLLRELRGKLRLDWAAEAFTEPDGDAAGGRGVLVTLLVRAASLLAGSAAGMLGRTVQNVPGGLLSAAAGTVAFVWLTADMEGAWQSLLRLLPPSAEEGANRVREALGRAGDGMARTLRAYLFMTGVTFAELLCGFFLLKIDGAPAAAMLTALVDILPVLGCGTVLIPWAALSFLTGDAGRGIGLLVLLAAAWGTRQALEPRLVGRATGVHPFLALAGTWLGVRLFGLAGLFAAAVVFAAAGNRPSDADKTENARTREGSARTRKEKGISRDNPAGRAARR